MKNTFAIGDIVKLKSGGPDMTVQSEPDSEYRRYYHCQWFAGKKLESGNFPEDSIESATPKSP